MRVIRASEIGTYLFCQRAWWYQLNGYEPENRTELVAGQVIHEKHARAVRLSRGLQVIATGLLIAALIFVFLWLSKI